MLSMYKCNMVAHNSNIYWLWNYQNIAGGMLIGINPWINNSQQNTYYTHQQMNNSHTHPYISHTTTKIELLRDSCHPYIILYMYCPLYSINLNIYSHIDTTLSLDYCPHKLYMCGMMSTVGMKDGMV